MNNDLLLNILTFIHDLYVALAIRFFEFGPVSIPISMGMMLGLHYVLYTIFISWPWDYRIWKSGGIGKASFSTDDFKRR